jgi:hypothetical protein
MLGSPTTVRHGLFRGAARSPPHPDRRIREQARQTGTRRPLHPDSVAPDTKLRTPPGLRRQQRDPPHRCRRDAAHAVAVAMGSGSGFSACAGASTYRLVHIRRRACVMPGKSRRGRLPRRGLSAGSRIGRLVTAGRADAGSPQSGRPATAIGQGMPFLTKSAVVVPPRFSHSWRSTVTP